MAVGIEYVLFPGVSDSALLRCVPTGSHSPTPPFQSCFCLCVLSELVTHTPAFLCWSYVWVAHHKLQGPLHIIVSDLENVSCPCGLLADIKQDGWCILFLLVFVFQAYVSHRQSPSDYYTCQILG